jgi:hypothetical protein
MEMLGELPYSFVCWTAGFVKTGMGSEDPAIDNIETVLPWFPSVLKANAETVSMLLQRASEAALPN